MRLSNTGSRVISELSFPNDAARFRSVPGTAISVYFTDDTPGATDCFDLPDQIQICPHTDLLLNPGDSVTYVITDFWGNCSSSSDTPVSEVVRLEFLDDGADAMAAWDLFAS